MGVKVDLSLILKVIALVGCCCAIGLSVEGLGSGRLSATLNCFIYATGGYIIVLAVFTGWAIFKEQVDTMVAGCVLIFGFIYNLAAGAALVSYYVQMNWPAVSCVAGVLDMVAGVLMLLDALHAFGVF
ncbi:uncharacterized protein LOC143202498 [Rhynchophorus ferrugineus]|uniref:uncharacterized protein LOC143202498 n=1 Tax=Rhynchophorus ferrugineus TaxID=354439 RepID=UPI003FCD517C